MVVDVTAPSLVLLALLAVGTVASPLVETLLARLRRAVRTVPHRAPAFVTDRWCPRVVLIDDDRWTSAAA